MHGQAWWTLGFEATGPVSLQRKELEATAALVFGQALPGGVELSTDDSPVLHVVAYHVPEPARLRCPAGK